ncbi:MAG: diaminopimelate epimerase, partial [Gemmatimonadota bacterium]|nr:diaminopimelate epimerase [Gemmatimonadota bacterium]
MTNPGAPERNAPLAGTRFWKMTGSGNDFVVIDARDGAPPGIEAPGAIAALCSRTDGIGADGVVLIERHPSDAFAIRYYNRDGSRGELCGNASLCSASLAVQLGLAGEGAFSFTTDIGPVRAVVSAGTPEIGLAPVQGLRPDVPIPLGPGERRIGFANTGVPHLVVLVDDTAAVDVPARGRELRHHPSLERGANVNFVSRGPAGWRMRTYERGVEAETQACGTGSVATAALLVAWGLTLAGPTAVT